MFIFFSISPAQQQSTPESQGGVNVGAVAGGVAGAIFLLVLAVLVALCILWRVRRRKNTRGQYILFEYVFGRENIARKGFI